MRKSVDRDRNAASASFQVATTLGGGAIGASISAVCTSGGGTTAGAAGPGAAAGATGAAAGCADAVVAPPRKRVVQRTMVRRRMGHRCKMEGHPARE